MEKSDVVFDDLRDLVNIINKSLGDFCDTFRYKRKELASLGRASSGGILFKYEDQSRDWAINEGGGTEIQYQLSYRNDTIGYGLGFNTQYVPFANKMSAVEYMTPFAKGYIQIKNSELVLKLKDQGFCFLGEAEDKLNQLQYDEYYLFGKEIHTQNNTIPLSEYNEMINHLEGDLFELYCSIFEKRNEIINGKDNNMELIELLRENKNLILTGAPGTGKTYLAKQIALSMLFNKQEENELTEDEKQLFNECFCFVQFHPSYDYTDFVEGLRPTPPDDKGNIGFERKDGIFKEFCKKALKAKVLNEVDNFEEAWANLIVMIKGNLAKGQLTKIGSWDYSLSKNDSLKYSSENTPSQYTFTITKQNVHDAYQQKKARPSGAFQKDMKDVVGYMKEHLELKDYQPGIITQNEESPKYIFVIDEINRGEISKIFGELFFSVDPGYRGEKGKVETQYANLIEDNDLFKDGFYVPDNVYIIGTMNDIDRSVESMDFAMRRRFAWKEIKSIDRISMWNGKIDEWKGAAKQRMQSLNAVIEKTRGLSAAYHIGPAYFLKLENYNGDFEKLWEIHLQGVLYEYLRGLPEVEEELTKLKQAYNLHP